MFASEMLESSRYILETSQMHKAYNSKGQSTEIDQVFKSSLPLYQLFAELDLRVFMEAGGTIWATIQFNDLTD